MRSVLALLLVVSALGCTSDPESAASPGTPTAALAQPIFVDVAFPQAAATLLGDTAGRVEDSSGTVVAEFEFASGWNVPADWDYGDPVDRSGAATVITVELPASGRYTFELDAYTLSNQPCGTCESGFAETSITVDVDDDSMVELPAGQRTWES